LSSPLEAGEGEASSVTVRTPERAPATYEVRIAAGAIGTLGAIAAESGQGGSGRVFLVRDAGLPPDFVETAITSLIEASLRVTEYELTPSEEAKSILTLATLERAIASSRHERRDVIVALGGGIVGDVAGFAAAIYQRGCPVIQCPTTLLAMVDASVGGKTGLNLDIPGSASGPDLLKNMLGAFHQPGGVIADLDALQSLPDRAFRSGLAECVKHGMLAADWGDADLFAWTAHHAEAILERDPGTLQELVARNVRVKAGVVEADERERESGAKSRAVLNLGHTFAHALETVPNLSPDGDPASAPLQHGEAVALGLVAASRAAARLGTADASLEPEVGALLTRLGLPTRVSNLPPGDTILARMLHDKKVAAGKLRLTLPTGPGTAALVDHVDPEIARAGISAISA